MKKISLSFTEYILIVIVFISFLTMYFSQSIIDYFLNSNQILQNTQTEYQKISNLAKEIENLKFDISIFKNNFLQNVSTLPEFPLDTNQAFTFGKPNPFSGSYIVVPNSLQEVLGGIRQIDQTFASTTNIITASTTQR